MTKEHMKVEWSNQILSGTS